MNDLGIRLKVKIGDELEAQDIFPPGTVLRIIGIEKGCLYILRNLTTWKTFKWNIAGTAWDKVKLLKIKPGSKKDYQTWLT